MDMDKEIKINNFMIVIYLSLYVLNLIICPNETDYPFNLLIECEAGYTKKRNRYAIYCVPKFQIIALFETL